MATISFHNALAGDVKPAFTFDTKGEWACQIKSMTKSAGPALRTAEEVALIGLPGAAIGQVSYMELASGLPTITLWAFAEGKPARVGNLNLGEYRHNAVRPMRAQIVEGAEYPGFTIIDGGGRGVPPYQMEELAAFLGCQASDIRVFDAGMGQSDLANPTVGVAEKLLSLGLTKADWQSGRIIFVPPGNGLIAVVQATAIYALSEVWPVVAILQADASKTFHMASLLDVQALRAAGPALAAMWTNDEMATYVANVAKAIGAEAEGQNLIIKIDDQVFTLAIASVSIK